MMTRRILDVFVASVIALTPYSSALGVLTPSEVVLLYNSEHRESNAIANYYLARHAGVLSFDLAPFFPQYQYPGTPGFDPDNPGTHAVNQFYITPQGFEDWVRVPLLQFISQHGAVKAIATTRGLPVVLATDFTPPTDHGESGLITVSFEGKLARLDITSATPSDEVVPNPYFGYDGVAFSDFLSGPAPGGSCYVGKMFLVSRLDSDKPVPAADYDGDSDVDYVDGVKALIDRSLNLVVNTVQTTLVLDDKPWGGTVPPDCLARNGRVLDYMYDQGWCTYYDASCDFLEGGLSPPASPGQQGWHSNVEGLYTDKPELVHSGYGRNHASPAMGLCGACEDPDNGYVLDYVPHPAGLFVSLESWNGTALREPSAWFHGQVWHWIARGGSFTCGNVNGPNHSAPAFADFVVTNLYVHRLSWGEAIWTSVVHLGGVQTPLGDPLARVTIHDPDVNNDHIVNNDDLLLVQAGADVDGDGDNDPDDILIVIDSWLHSCPFGPPNASNQTWPPPSPQPPLAVHWFGDALTEDTHTHDGLVTAVDLAAVLSEFGACDIVGTLNGDVTGDHLVTQEDILDVLCNWGRVWCDINGDCTVGQSDMEAVIAQWGSCSGCSADIAYDAGEWVAPVTNNLAPGPDGMVDQMDLNAVFANWGHTLANCHEPPPPAVLATIPPAYLTAYEYPDCNGNLIPDDCEIAQGWVEDANQNGVPDKCE